MGCAVDYFSPRARGEARDAEGLGAAPPRTPAARVIARLGGPKPTADLAEVSVKTVYRWSWPAAKGGAGGRVPHLAQTRLVAATAAWPAPLTFADFAPRDGEVLL